MALEKDVELDELYYLKHRKDVYPHRHFPYEDVILKRTTSPYIWKNPIMREYLGYLEKIQTLIIEKTAYLRNFYNYKRSKYDNNHCG